MYSTGNQVILQSIHCHMVRSERIEVLLVTSKVEEQEVELFINTHTGLHTPGGTTYPQLYPDVRAKD